MVERQKQYIQLRNYRSRKLRKNQTEAEQKLWQVLRDRQTIGVKFRRQHAIGGYITDFYCREAKMVIELDGGQHADPEAMKYDSERTRFLEERGLLVLRYWNHEVIKNLEAVVDDILYHIGKRVPHLP